MLGLPEGSVYLAPWSQQWEEDYSKEIYNINNMISQYTVNYHHIGSTAVKNLSAKPIIDIAVELNDFQDGYKCIEYLASIAYKHRIISDLPQRHYFSKGEPRTHQIHMYEKGNEYLKRQIAFRNYLRENEIARKEYQLIKEKLSITHSSDKLSYTDAKTDFINTVLSGLGYLLNQ